MAKAAQKVSNANTGSTSVKRKAGNSVSCTAQKRRMPIREKAIIPATPDNKTTPVSTQALLVAPELNNAADNRLNLATKPDRGGRPIISKAQAKNAIPKNTIGMGKGIPTVSSNPSSSPRSRRSKASSLTANSSDPKGCKRLIISSNKKKAPTANTELNK